MRIAAIYDIHGNLPALEAVLREVEEARADLVVVGGDVVAGPMPGAALARLLNLTEVRFLRGNADREVAAFLLGHEDSFASVEPDRATEWVSQQLEREHGELMAGWPETLSFELPGLGRVLFCHATPRSDTDVFTRRTPEARLLGLFKGVGADLVVSGHTHMQFDRQIGRTRVVNAGSVGMPYGERGAYWLLLDGEVRFQRTGYDFEAAAARIRRSGHPSAEEFAAHNVLRPPTEEEAIEVFEAVAVGSGDAER